MKPLPPAPSFGLPAPEHSRQMQQHRGPRAAAATPNGPRPAPHEIRKLVDALHDEILSHLPTDQRRAPHDRLAAIRASLAKPTSN